VSNPYVSKNRLEQELARSDSQLNATVALLREALRACPESEVRITGFSQVVPTNDLEISYDKATDTLIARVKA
jgi:hypothetical protein